MRSLFYGVAGTAAAAALVGCVAVTVPLVPGVAVTWRADLTPVAATIAKRLAPRLNQVLDHLRDKVLAAESTPMDPEDARRLITESEAKLVAILEDRAVVADLEADTEDLAPLRDYVRAAAAAARAELDEPRTAFLAPPGLALAVAREDARADLRWARRSDRPAGSGPLDLFLALIASFGERVDRSDLQTTLCAISRPPGGRFVLFPASAPDREREAFAAGTISNLWRGSYRYRVVMIDGPSLQEANLDLMNPERVTLDCAVEGGAVACREYSEIVPGCPT